MRWSCCSTARPYAASLATLCGGGAGGHAAADDSWLRLDELAHCAEKVAEYDAAAPRRRAARRSRRAAAVPPATLPDAPAPVLVPPALVAPAGFRLAGPSEVVGGSALVRRAILFFWPTVGWICGTVAHRSRVAGFSHVVRYRPRSALGAALILRLSSMRPRMARLAGGRFSALPAPAGGGHLSLSGTTVMVLRDRPLWPGPAWPAEATKS